eukprot:COSAG05_NODE_2074_length_3609_cov_4.982336_3_plen_222_part_00
MTELLEHENAERLAATIRQAHESLFARNETEKQQRAQMLSAQRERAHADELAYQEMLLHRESEQDRRSREQQERDEKQDRTWQWNNDPYYDDTRERAKAADHEEGQPEPNVHGEGMAAHKKVPAVQMWGEHFANVVRITSPERMTRAIARGSGHSTSDSDSDGGSSDGGNSGGRRQSSRQEQPRRRRRRRRRHDSGKSNKLVTKSASFEWKERYPEIFSSQ